MTEPSGDARAATGTEPGSWAAGEPGTQAAGEPHPRSVVEPPGGAAAGPRPDETGDARVDEAVALMASLDEAPVTDHVAVFDEVHRRLQDTLATLDRG